MPRSLSSKSMLRAPSLRHCLALLLIVLVMWSFAYINLSFVFSQPQTRSSQQVKSEIIQLSEEYIKQLAKENGNLVDGPYGGRSTTLDLKKTIAVLLDSMLARISRLETFVNTVTNGSLLINQTAIGQLQIGGGSAAVAAVVGGQAVEDKLEGLLQDINSLSGAQGQTCTLSEEDKKSYPACEGKIQWMRQLWKSDPCYKNYGVDGSDCSILVYLSEVEEFCPRPAWTGSLNKTHMENNRNETTYANISTELQPLKDLLVDPNDRQGYAWIRMRITNMWPRWIKAMQSLSSRYNYNKRRKQKILVHLGLLSKQSGWKFAEMQFKGGPLGELVQWSDLISTLYILGHELTITSEVEQLIEILNRVPAARTPCQSRKELPVQLIYTDIMGLIQFKKKLKAGYAKFSCLFRVVDTFGTEPAYNHRMFAKQNKILTTWGGQDLNPQQFFTMFPHSPDNSFMGFVTDRLLNDSHQKGEPKQNIALVYGKNDYMWEGKKDYLDAIHGHFELHGTVYYDKNNTLKNVPHYVVNHGLLNGLELHQLLHKAKIFVGLGFPYEGPAPLEAIANGAVFLNPRFNPPHNSKNTKFFKGKPTQREITSQHPYAEMLIGKPFVYTVNISNIHEVEKVLNTISEQKNFSTYLPYEYTEEGMLQRMNAYINNQQFCSSGPKNPDGRWPPSKAVEVVLGNAGKSCKDACWEIVRICEPSYFPDVNTQKAYTNFTECSSHAESSNIYYPAQDRETGVCTKQTEPRLFSCVGGMESLRRLCPCRDFIPGQTALCKGCER